MIQRGILERHELGDYVTELETFDYFNDYKDTVAWLRGLGTTQALCVAMDLATYNGKYTARLAASMKDVPEIDLLNPPPGTVADLQGKLRWFARLANARREADENLEQIKAKMAELEPHLLEEMATSGLERQTVDGITIYPQTDLIVSKKAEKDGVTTEKLVDALRACGLSYMVSEGYSASSLKSKVKEWRDSGVEVPAELAVLINVIDKPKLVTRKA